MTDETEVLAVPQKRPVGRPRKLTAEERVQRYDAQRKKNRSKYRSLVIDAELIAALHEYADRLQDTFGFRPTHSQVLRYLIRQRG